MLSLKIIGTMALQKAPDARRANPMVGATRRVARYRADRRAAPTFCNDEVAAQRRRWIFCEAIKIVAEIWILTKKKNVRVRGCEKG